MDDYTFNGTSRIPALDKLENVDNSYARCQNKNINWQTKHESV